MRLLLILISFYAGQSLGAVEVSKDELLGSFRSSAEYQNYLKKPPVSPQVIVKIEILELTAVVNLPNPHVANMFEKYLTENTTYSYRRVSSKLQKFDSAGT